jgi:putative ABC transport system permease protein
MIKWGAVGGRIRDLRLAIRSLRATPIVTVVSLATFALGIGANTVTFSFINGLVLTPLPYPHRDWLVSL